MWKQFDNKKIIFPKSLIMLSYLFDLLGSVTYFEKCGIFFTRNIKEMKEERISQIIYKEEQ